MADVGNIYDSSTVPGTNLDTSIRQSGIPEENTIPAKDIYVLGTSQVGISQISSTHIGVEQIGIPHPSTSQVSTLQIAMTQVSSVQFSLEQISIAQIGTAQVSADQNSMTQASSNQTSSTQVGFNQEDIVKISSHQIDSPEVSTLQTFWSIVGSKTNTNKIPLSGSVTTKQFIELHLDNGSAKKVMIHCNNE